jgi:hypothetical protein
VGTLRSQDLARMTEREADAAIERLAADIGRVNPDLDAEIRARVRDYEIRYEVSSQRMVEELRAGTRRETADIAEWLFWLRVLSGRGLGPGEA